MKILITGCNGYIGSSLTTYLSNLYEVIGISRQDFDLTDRESTDEWFRDKSFDVVIHTAIKGGSRLQNDTNDIISNNTIMYENLFSNRYRYSKFINLGSGAELYARNTPYGLSKHIICESILNNDKFYNIRIFGLFDENELDIRFIKSNIIRYINREPIIIHKNKFMDFFYMKDFLSLIDYYIISDNPQKEVNCSYRDKHSLFDIACMINNLSDYQVSINIEEDGIDNPYIGEFNLPINTNSLEKGIHNIYSIIKNQ